MQSRSGKLYVGATARETPVLSPGQGFALFIIQCKRKRILEEASKRREWWLLGIVIAIGLFILSKSFDFRLSDGEIALTITKQHGGISTIDTRRNESGRQEMWIQTLAFPEGRILTHPQYGSLGFSTNFFLDAKVRMQVKKPVDVTFLVRSDDGFRLKVDNAVICEHPKDRPMKTTTCRIHLEPGIHPLDLSYFQGGGPMGLEAKYMPKGEKPRFIGDDSDVIVFKAIK